MKLQKRIRIALLLCITVLICIFFGTISAVNADSDVVFSEVSIKKRYFLYDEFNLPSATVIKGDKSYDAKARVIFPDGNAYFAEDFTFTQSGGYVLDYWIVIDGVYYSKNYEFTVSENSEDLVTVTNATVKAGGTDYDIAYDGLEIKAKAGSKFKYNKVINLSDSTKDDLLIELVSAPYTMYKGEFTEFIITLTDIYDEENFINIRVFDALANSYIMSYVQAKAPNQRYVGLENGNPNFNTSAGGTVVAHSFGGHYGSVSSQTKHTIKLSWSAEENALYALDHHSVMTTVVDFDDISYITNPWKGFTTGEVYLTMVQGGVTADTRYIVHSINGITFPTKVPKDEFAPVIETDEPEEIPAAMVGREYKVFDVSAYDNLSVRSLTTEVIYRYESGNGVNVAVTDGKFIPMRAGDYTIVYKAEDWAGNSTEKMIPINCLENVANVSITVDGGDISVFAGENINLNSYSISGGVGNYDVSAVIKKDGNEVATVTGKKYAVLKNEGSYTVEINATDYIGLTANVSYNIIVNKATRPVLYEDT